MKKSPVCVKCGCEGTMVHLEENENGKRILNVFAIKGDREVMMTIDHIIPKSKGGRNDLLNLQTMCFDCNLEKGNKLELNKKNTKILFHNIELDKLDKKEAKRLFNNYRIYRLAGKDNMKKLGEIIWGEYHGDNSNISS